MVAIQDDGFVDLRKAHRDDVTSQQCEQPRILFRQTFEPIQCFKFELVQREPSHWSIRVAPHIRVRKLLGNRLKCQQQRTPRPYAKRRGPNLGVVHHVSHMSILSALFLAYCNVRMCRKYELFIETWKRTAQENLPWPRSIGEARLVQPSIQYAKGPVSEGQKVQTRGNGRRYRYLPASGSRCRGLKTMLPDMRAARRRKRDTRQCNRCTVAPGSHA